MNAVNQQINLVISDWNMPKCTGLDFSKRVRGDSRVEKTPFVLVTAEAEQYRILEALKTGVSNPWIKSFTAESILEKLKAVHKKLVG